MRILLSILLGLIWGGIVGSLVATLLGGRFGVFVGMVVTYLVWKNAENWLIKRQEQKGYLIFKKEESLPRILLFSALFFLIFLGIWNLKIIARHEWLHGITFVVFVFLSFFLGYKVVNLLDKKQKNQGFIIFAKENRIPAIIAINFIVIALYTLTWVAHSSEHKILQCIVGIPLFLSAVSMIIFMICRIWYAERAEVAKESELFLLSITFLLLALVVSIIGSFFTREMNGSIIALILVDILAIAVLLFFRMRFKKSQ